MATSTTDNYEALAERISDALDTLIKTGDSQALSDYIFEKDDEKRECIRGGVLLFLATSLRSINELNKARTKRLEAVEQRLATIEAQPRGIKYCGIWQGGTTYERGDVVSCAGSAWVAIDKNIVRPNDPSMGPRAWQLMVKRGADGKDAG